MSVRRKLAPILLSFIASTGLTVSPPAQAGLFAVSQKQEIQIGAQAAREMESKYPVSRDRHLNNLVKDIGGDLARVSDRPGLPWQFKVLNDKTVNAVSLPGGYVYVFKGLIDKVNGNRDMLAGVMAHEVAHVSAKHHAEMMEKQTTSNALISILLKGKSRDYAGLFSNIYALKWSRNDEYEADKLGVRFAARAGYDPYGLPRFLQVLKDMGGQSGSPNWLSTHPATDERVKRARQYAADYSSGSRYSERSRR